MRTFSGFSKEQYIFVQESRKILFEYCKTVDITSKIPAFGHSGSIRNLFVHIADCYQQWVANRVLKKNWSHLKYETYKDMDDIVRLYIFVDKFMSEFFTSMENPEQEIEYKKDGTIKSASAFKIFSHVITHEFHHKGQILSMSRHLGCIPVDTDILR